MDNLLDLLRKRRSTRKFMDTQLSPELVEQLLMAALMSPASKSSNPWQFVLVDDKDMLSALSTSKNSGSWLIAESALSVVVLGDPEKSDVWVEDCSIASIYLQLMAEELGLGSCWVQVRCRQDEAGEDSESVVRRLLDIPDNLRVESIIALGVKVESKPAFEDENLQWEKVHVGRFRPVELSE